MKDVHSWVQPVVIAALRPELLEFLLKHGENGTRGIAGFEPVSEWVGEKIILGACFVRFQGVIENCLEVGRCGSRLSVRHKGEVRDRGEDIRIVGNGEEERHASETCSYRI